MIIDFKIKNYRSIKDETTFSLQASGAKGKIENVAEIIVQNGKKFRLLKTAVIYGANASGKSTLIRAFWAFRQLIDRSFRNDVNEPLDLAEPFALDNETIEEPTEFTLNFIAWDKIQYIYFVSISKHEGIVEESLKYYPSKSQKVIFSRKGRNIKSLNLDIFPEKDSPKNINPKRLFLSELGNSGNEYWENMRNYFVLGNVVLNNAANGAQRGLTENAKIVFESNDKDFIEIKNKIIQLVKLSDLGIQDLELATEKQYNTEDENEKFYSSKRSSKRFKTFHNIYKDNQINGLREFDLLNQGSTGTIALVGICTEILLSLNMKTGRPIWIDELDNSMHPYLCRFLITLFHHPLTNPYNSQLIFATHETTLLDRNNFRKDQIWITSKDKFGKTELYSVFDLDIDGLRDDIPFDKWYMSGKFGGLPKIKEFDFIFNREQN
jgi:AAA15 family ATPase/GTPase